MVAAAEAKTLLARVKAVGCRIMASATTVAEAVWLEARGVDLVIAQGYEAGGHWGTFLAQSLNSASFSQPGTLALVPQVVDAVKVPVIAAGGIADGRGIAARCFDAPWLGEILTAGVANHRGTQLCQSGARTRRFGQKRVGLSRNSVR